MPRSLSHLSPFAPLCALLLAACGDTSRPVPPDFSVALSPAAQTVARSDTGATTSYSVTTAIVAGAPEQISLAVSGLPAGVTGSFNPSVLSGAGSSTLTLTIAGTAAAGTTTFTVTGSAASGTHTATASLAICIPGPVTLAVSQTSFYACHDGYRGTFTVTNGTCAPIEVSQVSLTGTIAVATSSPNCTGAGTSNYPLNPVVTIGPGLSAVALDLTGGHYCCTSSPCPNPFACDENYGYQVTTSAGVVTAPAQIAHIKLDGCADEVCLSGVITLSPASSAAAPFALAPGGTVTVGAAESGYSGAFTATSSNPAVATVAAGGTTGQFVVTGVASGTASISITSTKSSGAAVFYVSVAAAAAGNTFTIALPDQQGQAVSIPAAAGSKVVSGTVTFPVPPSGQTYPAGTVITVTVTNDVPAGFGFATPTQQVFGITFTSNVTLSAAALPALPALTVNLSQAGSPYLDGEVLLPLAAFANTCSIVSGTGTNGWSIGAQAVPQGLTAGVATGYDFYFGGRVCL